MRRIVAALFIAFCAFSASAANGLRVISAGPVGEVATIEEANEVRVVFSEPMVVLGRIPDRVTAPFFKIAPAVKGGFRWSGTTTLIFTPEKPLPYATEYTVTIDKSAKAVSGSTLDQPYEWTFTTPTIQLRVTDWYRKKNGAVVIGMRFNQPVDPNVILPHVQLRTQGHQIQAVEPPPGDKAAFNAKLAKAEASAASDGAPVLAFLATDWNKERFEPGKDLVVLETKPGIPPDTWIQLTLDERLAASPKHAPTGHVQSYTIELEPTFFVLGIDCKVDCDPERYTGIQFRSGRGVRFEDARKAVTVTDITDPAKEVPLKAEASSSEYDYPQWGFGLDELGFSVRPARKYRVRVDPSLTADDGQKLGYVWTATVDYWHKSAFVSFGSGHGVWESSGGPILPFHARNFKSVKQWLAPLSIDQLMPAMQELRNNGFTTAPPNAKPRTRALELPVDKIASIGLDLKPAIGDDNRGFVWAAIEPGQSIARSLIIDPSVRATIVQTTNLGISVKDSPFNTLIFVTTLDGAKPVEGATVTIRDRANKVFWTGTTDANGLAVARNTDLRRGMEGEGDDDFSWTHLGELHFIVTAEKDGDAAYVGSDWTEGITPWDFNNIRWGLGEADPQLRGTIFADRGVYKLGEEVHFKAIVRADEADGMKLAAPGTSMTLVVRDSHGTDIDTQTIDLGAWSSADWTWKVPADAPLGTYSIEGTTEHHEGTISGSFLVAAYRRPDFRVDVTLDAASTLAGTKLDGRVIGRYLYGGTMSGQSVSWTYSKAKLNDVPRAVSERWSPDRFAFLDEDNEWTDDGGTVKISSNEATLDTKGVLAMKLDTDLAAGWPFAYTFEGTVTDVTRQQISNRATFRVDPAPWYLGVKRPPYFVEAKDGINTEIVAAAIDGLATPGVPVKVELKRIQWASVRQSEGEGFYEWESERKEIAAGSWTVDTKAEPVPLNIPLKEGGEYMLAATATDAQGRVATTRVAFYALGAGYTAWERFDHNRIDLVPEKQTWKPGDNARIMVKSPWETATALLTTEREGVRTWTPFQLTSTQQTITVPITEKDIPNVFVSVLLIKGRTQQDPGKDGSDPGKPSFRLGYIELKVEDAAKRLQVDVKANRDEYRPSTKASIEVNVRDAKGKPSQAEVTLWAVDYGVLSLTDYRRPDVLKDVYLEKALQVVTEDSRQRIISRRVMTPKGATEGGGGGRDAGPGTLRKDFRVLAFWVGSLVTDAKGRAKTEVTLPDSLTTYRIMAVAADKQSRFGGDDAEIRINKPLMLTPAWPRFLTVGDKAHFGGVIHNQLARGGKATVSIESLDPQVLEIKGTNSVQIAPKTPLEVRFDAVAKSVGIARIRMRVAMGRETDAFEDVIPVRVLVSPETVAAYGEAKPRAEEKLEVPADAVPGFGGLRVDLSSTAMVGLSEGARYLVEYPYGCAEQRSSRALALMLVTDLGAAFNLPGIEPGKNKVAVQTALEELETFQCGDGGFSFWPGQCHHPSSPFLTSYVVHVFQRGAKLGYTADADMLQRALAFLDTNLGQPQPTNEGWMPAYTAWQSFAVKVLAEGGQNVDSHVNRLYGYRDRMPVFGIAFLADALIAKGETTGARITDLKRRINNAVLPEGGHAFVNELNDPNLLWFWNSNVRSTAIAMGTLIRHGSDEEIVKRMVRWLMQVRKEGRWGNTQENAWAMESLVDYYRKYEAEVPDFIGTVSLGTETIATETFKGRSTDVRSKQFSMADLLRRPATSSIVMLREGTGTLFYMLRLRYARNIMNLQPLDAGFRVERSYTVQGADAAATSFKAGDLVQVTLRIRNTKERRYVAVTDPIPAGTEPVDTYFATTASQLVQQQLEAQTGDWMERWQRGGWDYVERHDDRVNVFATRLGEGTHVFTYLVRATTAGTFITAPAHAEEMYEPEVFGRTGTVTVEVAK